MYAYLGTRVLEPKATRVLNEATKAAIALRDHCHELLIATENDPNSQTADRVAARRNFVKARRAAGVATSRQREIDELKLFREVEAKDKDSSAFWKKVGSLKNSITTDKAPPPIAINSEGTTVTDPVEAIAAWRDFSAGIASKDLVGSREEGIYNEEHLNKQNQRLAERNAK